MSDPFVAEVRIFPYNFAPRSWAFCNGQILPIAQNTALFALIGTIYGGDGRTTMALPNLVDRVVMHAGAGPGLTPRQAGETGGVGEVPLGTHALPSHTHVSTASAQSAETPVAAGRFLARSPGAYQTNLTNLVPMDAAAVGSVGGSQPHNNRMPAQRVNYCIALTGIFPPRS